MCLMFVILPTSRLHAQKSGTKSDTSFQSLKTIENTISKDTPPAVGKPVLIIAQAVEEVRVYAGKVVEDKKQKIDSEIKSWPDKKAKQPAPKTYIKLFIYFEFYVFAFFSFIINHKYLFYVVFILGIIFLIRFVWGLIFSSD